MKKYFSLLLLSGLFAALAIQAGYEEHLKQFEETGYCKKCDLSNFDLRPSIAKFNKLNDERKAIYNLAKLHNVEDLHDLYNKKKISPEELVSGKIKGINLEGSDLSGSNLSGCNLADANLDWVKAEGANFEKTNLTRASLRFAFLKNINFKKSNLRSAYLTGINVLFSNFKKANFEDAFLRDANFLGANVEKAKFDSYDWKMKAAYIPGVTDFSSRMCKWWNSK